MSYEPQFTVTHKLLARVEKIAALREQILAATVQVRWIPALQKDTRTRNTHSSTAIEGNPLTLEQVKAVEEGREVPAVAARAKREVVNYFAGLRFVEKNALKKSISHEDIFRLHKIIAGEVMDQGAAGRYRTIAVRVGRYVPPPPQDVSGLMFELLTWWNKESVGLSPVLSSAILHFQFEAIHPFADGNGRTGRALALWELYRRGFDTHHIFSVDEFYWENRPRYYEALDNVRRNAGDLTGWLEYAAEGLHLTLERVWQRVQKLSAQAGTGETHLASEAGAAFAVATRPQEHDAARALGGDWRVQTRCAGFVAATDQSRIGEACRHEEIRALHRSVTKGRGRSRIRAEFIFKPSEPCPPPASRASASFPNCFGFHTWENSRSLAAFAFALCRAQPLSVFVRRCGLLRFRRVLAGVFILYHSKRNKHHSLNDT